MRGAELGRGVVDYRPIFSAAEAAGLQHYFAEQEGPFARMNQLQAAQVAYDYCIRLIERQVARMFAATPLLPECSARDDGSVGTSTPAVPWQTTRAPRAHWRPRLIEQHILPRVILEDQKLRDRQQQGGKQRNQIGDFHETLLV